MRIADISWKYVLLGIYLVSFSVASLIFSAQFHGEDELGVYITASWLVELIVQGDLFSFLRILVGSYHPPGRFLLAVVSFILLGPSAFALRLPAVLIWAATCVLAADTARRLSGRVAGLIVGILLSVSGLYALQALGFGHGVLTFWVMLFVWFKVRTPTWSLVSKTARRDYVIGGVILGLGFLWFTSLLPIAGMYHLYYAYKAVREKVVGRYLLITAGFFAFYAIYYAIFLGIPWYAVEAGIRQRPVGQLYQNLVRSGEARVNVESFVENLKGINWYHVPFISWVLLVAGIFWQWRCGREFLIILGPYALIFSFYLIGNTAQHFLSYYIWMVPFAIAGLWQFAHLRGQDWRGAMASFLIAICIASGLFGYVANTRRYTETDYPTWLQQSFFASGKWRTNLVRPLPQIAEDLSVVLGPEDLWTVTIDGPLSMYYFVDDRFAETVFEDHVFNGRSCLALVSDVNVAAIVRSSTQAPLCDKDYVSLTAYEGSYLEIVMR